MKKVIFLVFTFITFNGAFADTLNMQSRPEVQAHGLLGRPTTKKAFGGSIGDINFANNAMVINKGALEKEYLLRGHFIPQEISPSGNSIKSRVVAFRQRGNQVYLMEATQGHVVTNDLPSSLILGALPILSETDTTVTVDWNAGMRQVFASGDWYTSDFSGVAYKPSWQWLPATYSYINKAEVLGDRLSISQIVQLQLKDKDGNATAQSVELRYMLEPYRANVNFEPKVQTEWERTRLGYFEVTPILEAQTGRAITHVSRWPTDKQITYYISANTPESIRDAVRDGVLYWNRAFGREFLKVEMAPAGVAAPSDGYNIVQWVPWDKAGFAYADANMDPRTGEIKQANVYLTSAFLANNRYAAEKLLRLLEDGTAAEPILFSHTYCHYELNAKLISTLREVLTQPELNDDFYQKINHDIISAVVAHEVGHTLGLRHNFAGSLGLTAGLDARDQAFNYYVQTQGKGRSPDIITTTSVMDYNVSRDQILFSDKVAKEPQFIAEYDRVVMKNLYGNENIPEELIPAYCTDSQIAKYVDCKQFDSGNSAIEYSVYELKDYIEKFPRNFLENFYFSKRAEDERDRRPLEKVALNPEADAKKYGELLWNFLSLFSENARFFNIEYRFSSADQLHREGEIKNVKRTWMADELARLGKQNQNIMQLFLTVFTDQKSRTLENQFNTIFTTLLTEKSYSPVFDAKETNWLKDTGKAYFAKFLDYAPGFSLQALLGKNPNQANASAAGADDDDQAASAKADPLNKLETGPWLEAIENAMATVSQRTIFTIGDNIVGQIADHSVTVPGYFYKDKDREAAVSLIKFSRSPWNDWMFSQKANIQKTWAEQTEKMKKEIDPNLFDEKTWPNMSRELRRWSMEQKQINDLLTKE